MELSHYLSLYPAYFSALIIWIFLSPYLKLKETSPEETFEKPWLEFLFSIGAVIMTVLIGQLYVNSLLIPSSDATKFLIDSINHTLIFSPFVALLLIRKQSFQTAWIPRRNKVKSIIIGLGLAILAIFVFLLSKGSVNEFFTILKSVYSLSNLHLLVQVFLEDLAIAICFFRFQSLVGKNAAIVAVGILFSLAHIPAMITSGVDLENFLGLVFDALLGIFALVVISRSRNILWFWMIHYAMDMMQFYN